MKNCITKSLIICVLVVILIISVVDVRDKLFGVNDNLNEEFVIRKQEVDSLEFKEISHVYGKNIGSKITVVITNVSDTIYYIDGFNAVVKDEDGRLIDTLKVHMYDKLEPNESFEYLLRSEKDLVTNKKYTIEFEPIRWQ